MEEIDLYAGDHEAGDGGGSRLRFEREAIRALDLAWRRLARTLEDCPVGAKLTEESRDALLETKGRLERLARRWRLKTRGRSITDRE